MAHTTIEDWCAKYGIGALVDGRWHIDRAALDRIVRARAVLGRGDRRAAG